MSDIKLWCAQYLVNDGETSNVILYVNMDYSDISILSRIGGYHQDFYKFTYDRMPDIKPIPKGLASIFTTPEFVEGSDLDTFLKWANIASLILKKHR